MSKTVLKNTLKNASYNVVFQVFVKAFTFFLNALALRYITKDVVGVINVRLLLLESTIVFISREAFRKAALSQSETQSWPQIINLMWLTVPLSVVTSFIFSYIWLNLLELPSYDVTSHYATGVWSVSVGCIIEMLTEPLNIISQAFAFIKLKIILSSILIVIRAIIFVPWIVLKPNNAVLAFSFAQVISNMLYVIIYYSYFYYYMSKSIQKENSNLSYEVKSDNEMKKDTSTFKKNFKFEIQQDIFTTDDVVNVKNKGKDTDINDFPFTSLKEFFPKSFMNKEWIHPSSAYLTWNFFKQGILKQILTEGERYIMTLFSVMTFQEQGLYDIINNLGSLAVRFLFRPVEESLYFYFTQSIGRDKKIMDQNQETIKETSTVLKQSLNCFVDIGLLIFTFGQSYSALLLHLYGGKDLASGKGPILLQVHCFSILLLGINGITECYTFSTMSADQLDRHNYLMAAFSIFFLVISWTLTQLFGGVGFILANCCNMLARIYSSIVFIKNKFIDTPYKPLQGLLPTKLYSISLLGTLIITKGTEYYCNVLLHFVVGVFLLAIVFAIWCSEKKQLVVLLINKWKQRKVFKTE